MKGREVALPDPGLLALSLALPHPAGDHSDDPLVEFLADRLHSWQKKRCELRQVTVEVTRRCNLACRHCYVRCGPKRRPREELSFADLLGLGFSLRQAYGKRVGLAVTGGEPLARPDLLPVLRFWRKLGLSVTVATNGTLIDDTNAPLLARYLSGVSVSIDGLRKTHDRLRGRGSFRAALRGLFRLRGLGLSELQVKTAVHRGNLRELPALHRVVATLGVDRWHIFPVEGSGRAGSRGFGVLGRREFGALCDFYDAVKGDPVLDVCFEEQNGFQRKRPARECGKLRRCGAGINAAAVLADGSVVACVLEGRRGGVQGNVRERSFTQIWEHGFERYRAPDWRSCPCHLSGSGS